MVEHRAGMTARSLAAAALALGLLSACAAGPAAPPVSQPAREGAAPVRPATPPPATPPQGRIPPTVTAPPAPAQAAPAPAAAVSAPSAAASASTPGIVAPLRVGLLLPLSGRYAALGTALANAAEMALFDAPTSGVELIIRDTEASTSGLAPTDSGVAGAKAPSVVAAEAPSVAGAEAAARSAMAAGASVLVGPLFSAQTRAVRTAVPLPVLSFSNDTAVAGPDTWVLGFQPRDQVRRVLDYAVARGLGRVALLAPVGGLGDVVEGAVRQAVQADGGTLVDVGRYEPNQRDIGQVIRRLAALPPGPAPQTVAPQASVASQATGAATGTGPAPTVDGATPAVQPPFQAILIADGGQHLREVAPMLPFFDLDPGRIKFLGTGQWDDVGLGREPSLVGGWYAAPDPRGRAAFERRYRQVYGRPPQRLATLAYDAVSLVAAVGRHRDPAGPFPVAGLTDPKGYTGLDGAFRLLADGQVERALAVLEVTREGVEVVDPAPATFGGSAPAVPPADRPATDHPAP